MFTKPNQDTWQPQSHWSCPSIWAKKEFPHNKHIYFLTKGTSLLCIDQVSGNPHISISWFQSHSLLSDQLPLYILLVILTENEKYTSLMAYLFTRDMWHCFPFQSSSIPQHNWLPSLKVNSPITSVSHLFNLTSSQTNIFVASALAALTYSHETREQLLHTVTDGSGQNSPKLAGVRGDEEYWILQIKGGKYLSFPTGKWCIPPKRSQY